MKDWKIITVFAGSAFVLSIAAGIAGGVSFLILFLRAVAGGIVFGGLGFLVSFVFRKYLPELFTINGEGAVQTEENGETEGAPNIDIVIDDEQEEVSGAEGQYAESQMEPVEGEIKMEEEVSIPVPAEDIGEILQSENPDELPNIEAFSDSFNSAELEQNDGASLTGSVSVDIMGQEEDPGTVAKAIRTIMKKDQEG